MAFQEHPKICPICQQGKKFKFIRDYRKKEDKFSLYQCSKCQVQFWLPLKNPGVRWYEENSGYGIRNVIWPKISRGYHKKFLELYKNFSKNTKILDLGCGTGEFINELQKRGCQVWGVDFDKEAIKIAKEHFGLENVFSISFKDFFQKRDLPKFDIICFFEVIEHLDNPLKFIQNVKNLLRSNGKIVLSTPCRERMLLNLNSWDFPLRHFTRWDKEAISNLFQRYNFDISYINYLEQFKILSESVDGKFRTGLVNKSLGLSGNKKRFLIFPKIIYFLGCLKHLLIGKVPASFLWVIGKIFKYNNGIMLIELKKNYEK